MKRLIVLLPLVCTLAACHEVTQPEARDAVLDGPRFAVAGSKTQVTSYASHHMHPAISGDLIVWADERDGGAGSFEYQIYGCEWDAGTSSCAETQITNLTGSQNFPAVSGNLIAWVGGSASADERIWACEWTGSGCTNTHAVSSATNRQSQPAVAGKLIVWVQDKLIGYSTTKDIYACEWQGSGCTSAVAITSTDSESEEGPDVSGNLIVWLNVSTQGVYACEWNGSGCASPQMIGDGSSYPAVSGGKIVWAHQNTALDVWNLYTCQWPCSAVQTLISLPDDHLYVVPNISLLAGDWLIWMEHTDPPDETALYIYDPDVPAHRTLIALDVSFPDISGSRVVWYDKVSENLQVFMYEIAPASQVGGIEDKVKDLENSGVLTSDQASGLLDKLKEILAKIEAGNDNTAVNQLKAFIKQVQAFVNAGALPQAEGQQLIDWAEATIKQLTA